MKTKEEILKAVVIKNRSQKKEEGFYFGNDVFEAMDTYAEQVAKEFAEWINKNDYVFQDRYLNITEYSEEYVSLNKWVLRNDSFQIGDIDFDYIALTTSELYELFIKTK